MRKNLLSIALLVVSMALLLLTLARGEGAAPMAEAGKPALAVGIEPPLPVEPNVEDEVFARKVSLPTTPERRLLLDEAIADVAQAAHCNIRVEWRALKAAGVESDEPVLLNSPLKDVSVREALKAISHGLSSNVAGADWWNGVIVFSTRDELAKNTSIVIYNIRDIVDANMQYQAAHGEKATAQNCLDELTRILTDTVAPDTWRDAGASIGSMREILGLLVITQTPENQREIADMLASIRRASRLSAPAQVRATEESGEQ